MEEKYLTILQNSLDKINTSIKNVEYAKINWRTSAVLNCCGSAKNDLNEILNELTSIINQLKTNAEQNKKTIDTLQGCIDKINLSIKNVEYAKNHLRTTAVISCCSNAKNDLTEVQKDLSTIANQSTKDTNQNDGHEGEGPSL